MLASARPTTACCRTATRVLVARPSSSSRAAEKSTASQQSSLTSKEWRVRRRVIKAAVFGNREVEERLADPSAPVAGPSSGPRSTYLEQGFRPTPSRGHAKPSVEQPKSIKDEEEALKLRHYVSRAAIQRHLRRRASSSRSFSTSATAALRDDRASTSTPTPQSLATGKHATVAAKVTPPPYPAEDLAEDELDVLDGLDDVAPEGSFDARVKGQRRHVPGSDNSNYGTLAPGCWVESRR